MEVGDIEERKQSTALCKAAAACLPTDVLKIIWNLHPASTHELAWGRVTKELTYKKQILGHIMFNTWYRMTLVNCKEDTHG
eukprot:9533576-Ditylum_brightwellii.AAC.1